MCLTDRDGGVVALQRDLPHTITEWVGSTICVSPQLGLGIAPPMHLTAFQPFFLDYTMPYSVKRGEVVQLKVSLFNFLSYSLPVRIRQYLGTLYLFVMYLTCDRQERKDVLQFLHIYFFKCSLCCFTYFIAIHINMLYICISYIHASLGN